MSWDYNAPRSNDDLSDFPAALRELKSAISDGIGKHFLWQENSGTSAGEPRLSTVTGGARAFYAAGSAVSANQDGALMVTSDTNRLAILSSDQSSYVGSTKAIIGYSASTFTSTEQFAVQCGSVYTSGVSATVQGITFGSAFSASPLITVSLGWSSSTPGWTASMLSANASGFSYAMLQLGTGSSSSATLYWVARGRMAR